MKQTVLLTTCPKCQRPLAALTVGDAHAVQWHAITDNVIDLGADPLLWCPSCNVALPASYPKAEEA